MSIVRSLLVSLGFKVDKKSAKEADQTIKGFSKQLLVVGTAATYAFRIVKNAISNISNGILESDELARSLGLSLAEIESLQEGFQKFRISDSSFKSLFATLQKDLDDFKKGVGRLPEIIRQTGIQVTENSPLTTYFEELIKYLGQFENETDRINVSSELFGEALKVKLSDLSANFDEFKKTVSETYTVLKDTPDLTDKFKDYEQQLNNISKSFSDLVKTFTIELSPLISKLFELLQYALGYVGGSLSFLSGGGFEKSIKSNEEGLGLLSRFGNWLSSGFESAGNSLLNLDPRNNMQPAFYVNNTIDVNVPQGTTAEQTKFLSEEMQSLIDDSIMDTFYRIQNNNPQVE